MEQEASNEGHYNTGDASATSDAESLAHTSSTPLAAATFLLAVPPFTFLFAS